MPEDYRLSEKDKEDKKNNDIKSILYLLVIAICCAIFLRHLQI